MTSLILGLEIAAGVVGYFFVGVLGVWALGLAYYFRFEKDIFEGRLREWLAVLLWPVVFSVLCLALLHLKVGRVKR